MLLVSRMTFAIAILNGESHKKDVREDKENLLTDERQSQESWSVNSSCLLPIVKPSLYNMFILWFLLQEIKN